MTTAGFLELLLAGASRDELDAAVTDAERAGASTDQLAAIRREHGLALQVHEQMARQRSREAELSALYDTAHDLTAIRDLDGILAAIVRRARQLLHADMTYLSLNDEAEGASYMKVTDGALTAEFRTLRLPLGTGLLGLVAQTGAPYFTEDYQADERFLHREYIDTAVAGEQIRAILGVPLSVDGVVIGALLAVHRSVRRFPASEVALLTSFAAHASVALENARLFEEADKANLELRQRSEATEQAARAHDRLTDLVLTGGGVDEVSTVLAELLGGTLTVYDETDPPGVGGAVEQALTSGRCVPLGDHADSWVAVAAAGDEHLGTLLLADAHDLTPVEQRTFERGALVTALVLLFRRTRAEAEERVREELLADLFTGRDVDPDRVRDRGRMQGARLDGPVTVAVAAVEGAERHRAARVADAVAMAVSGLGGEIEGRIVVVVPGDEALAAGEQLRSGLASLGAVATVGVAVGEWPEGGRAAWREARRCLDTLLTLGRTGEVSDPAGLGLARLLLGDNGPGELDDFVEATVGPVLAYDAERGTALAETLEAWFAAGGGPRATAELLHVHANTVAQRLERVGRLLGDGWRDPARALDVQLALRMRRLRR